METKPSPSVFLGFFQLLKKIFLSLTLEPSLFLIAFSGSIEEIPLNQLLIDKSCRIDFNFNDTVCDNLLTINYTDENTLVQNKIAQFNAYMPLVSSLFPIFFAFYLGAWSDIFGRKICIYLFLTAKIIGSLTVIIVAYFEDLPKEWFLFSLIPTALVGGYGAFFMGINSFISDISEPSERAFRMAILNIAGSIARPVAPPVASYLLNTGGFVCVFSASTVIYAISFLFIVLRLRSFKWVNTRKQVRQPFSLYHIKDAFNTTFKKRAGPARKYILILLLSAVFIVIPFFGEYSVIYLYVRTRYLWELEDYSTYISIVSTAAIIGQAVIIPLIAFLKFRDSVALLVIMCSILVRQILKAFAVESWMFYLGDFCAILDQYSMSLVRALLTACVPMAEFGKIFSTVSAIESLVHIASTQAYASVWKVSSTTFPGTVFIMSAAVTSVSIGLLISLVISLRGKRLSDATQIDKNEEDLFVAHVTLGIHNETRITSI